MKSVLKYTALALLMILISIAASFQYSRSWKRSFFIDPIHQFNTDEKVVALTFDDGPSELRTPLLLDILDKHQVKATFFMLGENIEKYPELAKEVYERGHLLAIILLTTLN